MDDLEQVTSFLSPRALLSHVIVLYPRDYCEVKLMLAKLTGQCGELVSKCSVKYKLPRSLHGSPIQQVRIEPSVPGTVHNTILSVPASTPLD